MGVDRYGRDRSEGRRRTGRSDRESSPAYTAYKAKLDKMFVPGGTSLPPELAEKLGPPSPETVARRAAAAALAEAPSDERYRDALAHGAVPEDPRALLGFIDHLHESEHLRDALGRLLRLAETGRKPNRALALQRLGQLELRGLDEDLAELSLDLRGALEG